MDIRLKFAAQGSITFYGGFGDEQTNIWRLMARQPTAWFTDMLDGVLEDASRIHALVPDEESRNMSRILTKFYKTFIVDSEPSEWRWIKTTANSGDLPPRREVPSVQPGGDFMDVGAIPGGIIVALDDDTCLYVYGWNCNVALRSERKLVTLH
ncbi:unnamed protein product [Phytophthora lilii]|uniref:Unnamed protein product n=1 Tax=Phytophthora lilii TaxID=2077276 RepID=A0A9W7D858_9STRA|nr:unnamed protein product [Phytophthora lilii]